MEDVGGKKKTAQEVNKGEAAEVDQFLQQASLHQTQPTYPYQKNYSLQQKDSSMCIVHTRRSLRFKNYSQSGMVIQ